MDDDKKTEKVNNAYWPPLDQYNPGITSEQWKRFLEKDREEYPSTLRMLKCMLEMGGEASCKQIAARLKIATAPCISRGGALGKRAGKAFHVDPVWDNGKVYRFVVPFLGRRIENGLFAWRLRDELREALEQMDLSDIELTGDEVSMRYDKNMILYGPPGTGKTYNTAINAVKICDPDFDVSNYQEVMERYNQLKSEHRIAFTTFHQSYGYEEFIEGIKPVLDGEESELGYKIEAGVFKKFCEMARTPANIEVDPNASIWFIRFEDNSKTMKDTCFNNHVLRIDISEDSDWTKERFVNKMQIGDYILSYAGNSVYIDAIGVVVGEVIHEESTVSYAWKRNVKWHVFDEKVNVLSINSNTYLPNFSIAKMNHMKLSDLLRLLPESNVDDEEKPYVFIIDEINRGNISKIFGELITLIEETKREGSDETVSAILPYSGEEFSVPANVYIIGTMNTADRSIQLMDTALRRRFRFVEMMPDSDVLRELGIEEVDFSGIKLNVAAMLDAINERIAFLYDREHTIGHAFFTGLADCPTIEKLASIFEKSVIPLLQEYFYEDYQKIQLVLGDNAKTDPATKFIVDKKIELKSLFMGNVEDVVDEKEVSYEINHSAFLNINAYKTIAKDL